MPDAIVKQLTSLPGITLRPFRLLRVFKAMIRVRTFSAMKAIIQTLKQVRPTERESSLLTTYWSESTLSS